MAKPVTAPRAPCGTVSKLRLNQKGAARVRGARGQVKTERTRAPRHCRHLKPSTLNFPFEYPEGSVDEKIVVPAPVEPHEAWADCVGGHAVSLSQPGAARRAAVWVISARARPGNERRGAGRPRAQRQRRHAERGGEHRDVPATRSS